MKKQIAVGLAAATLLGGPVPAFAQFGSLAGFLPGHSTSSVAVDPDAFLADTLSTTKYMMIAAALLAQAGRNKEDLASQASYVAAVEGAQDCQELDAQKAKFNDDLNALSANDQSTTAVQSAYANGTAQQKQIIASAAYNLLLGMYNNIRLGQEASALLSGIRTNPMLLTQARALKDAAGLVALEARGTVSILGSMHTLMTTIKVVAPVEATATKPRPITF
jgi:hypothetical protein